MAEELFQVNMNPAPSIGDELTLDHETYFVTGRWFVLEDTQQEVKNVEYTMLFGRTLCRACHKKTDTYKNGAKKLMAKLRKEGKVSLTTYPPLPLPLCRTLILRFGFFTYSRIKRIHIN